MGALLVGVALVYATVAQGAFAADQAVVVFGLVVLAAVVAVVGRRRVPRPVAVAVGLVVVLAAWTAARAAGLADGPDVLHGHLGDGGGLGVAGSADRGLGAVGDVGAVGAAAGGAAGAGGGGGWLGAAVWAGLPIIAIAAAAVAVAGLAARARAVLTAVVIAAGLLVAATGWVGVAWHIEPLALVSSGLWRASSTLTYANASASFLVTALFVTAAAAGRLGPRRARLVTAALLVGLLATMSRAGLAALVIGGLVVALAVSARWGSQQGDIPPTQSQRCHPAAARTRAPSAWRSLAALWPAVPGAAVAAAGLLPGLAEGSAPRPLLAVAALAAGLGFAALTPHRHAAVPTPDHAAAGHAPDPAAARHAPDPTAAMRASASRRRVIAATAVVAALLAAVPLAAGRQAGPVGALVASRLSAESPERADLRRVTAEQFATAPLTGVGPGRLDLVYVDYLGRLVAAEYTHDEFLQTAAETGLVGAGLAVAVFACLGAAAFRSRHTAGGPFAAAILAAFAAHSTFDFLWHIPVLPLLVTAAVVPLLDRPSHHEEEVTR